MKILLIHGVRTLQFLISACIWPAKNWSFYEGDFLTFLLGYHHSPRLGCIYSRQSGNPLKGPTKNQSFNTIPGSNTQFTLNITFPFQSYCLYCTFLWPDSAAPCHIEYRCGGEKWGQSCFLLMISPQLGACPILGISHGNFRPLLHRITGWVEQRIPDGLWS